MGRVRLLLAIGSLGGGGSERQIIGLLQRINRDRFAPHLFLVRREGPLLKEVPSDVPVHTFWDNRMPPRINWPGRIHQQQVVVLRKLIAQWKIDCVYDRNFHTTLITAPACRGIPRISTVVGDPDFDLRLQETRFIAIKRRLLRRAYQTASRVVAVSEGVRQSLLDVYDLPSDQVVTIHSPVDLPRVARLAAEPPAFTMAKERFHVIVAGRLLESKGCADLVEAVGICIRRGARQLQAHFLGEGPLRSSLESQIADLGIEEHVHLHGFLPNPYAVFSHANLVCHPSHSEGLPNVLLEAMACETPVLATDCRSGPREILLDGRLGMLVPPRDPEALADALTSILADENASRALVPAALQRIREDFGPTQNVQRLENLVEELVQTK